MECQNKTDTNSDTMSTMIEIYLKYNSLIKRAINHDRSQEIHVLTVLTIVTQEMIWAMA